MSPAGGQGKRRLPGQLVGGHRISSARNSQPRSLVHRKAGLVPDTAEGGDGYRRPNATEIFHRPAAETGRTAGQAPARTQKGLGSERGLATPSPDGKGEIPLGPSVKIMPVDSYSTLGRSCEPAFKWIPDPGRARIRARAARQRQTPAGGWSALGGHEVSCSFTWPGRVLARPEAPNPGTRPVPSGAGSVSLTC